MRSRERLVASIALAWILTGVSLSLSPSASYADVAVERWGPDSNPAPLATFVLDTFPVGADAFIQQANPSRNFGLADALILGGNAGNGTAYRTLAWFNLTGIPMQAAVQSATLRAYALQGAPAQTIDAHRVRASWIEGTGSQFGYRTLLTVTETAGVRRVREPVDLTFTLPVSLSTFVPSDFRVYDDGGLEVPSQLYGATWSGPSITEVHVVFGATVDASSARTYTLYYGNVVPIVPAFRRGTFGTELWNFTAGAKYAGLTAVDLDDDGTLEVVFGSHNGHIYALTWDGRELWNYTTSDVVEYSSTVVDIDGDGDLEIVYATSGNSDYRIYALNATSRVEEWNTGSFPTKAFYVPIAIGDLDGDGTQELFAGSQDRSLYAFYANGTLRWAIPLGGSTWGNGATVGNLAGTAAPEVVYATSTGTYYAIRADQSILWIASPGSNSNLAPPSLGDIDRDGLLDLVAGDNAQNGNEFAVKGTDGSTLWSPTTFSNQAGGQVLVDFNDDGRLETVFVKTRRGEVAAINSTGAQLWSTYVGDLIYSIPAAADINMDGVEEILVGVGDPITLGNSNLAILNSNGAIVAQIPTPDAVTATPIVADLDGDGTMEIVFSTRTRTYAYSTASLGHDYRTLGYNYRLTDRFLDGNSPNGVALLSTAVGGTVSLGGTGVTWQTRNGTYAWASPGADYDAAVVASAAVGGNDTWLSWNITALVQSWVDGTQPNVGILLKARSEASAGLTSLSSREGAPGFALALDVVYNPNIAPTIRTPVPTQSYPEDTASWNLALVAFAEDPDTPISRLRWDLSGVDRTLYDYTGGNVSGNHILTFWPEENAFGTDFVTLFLFDDDGNYASQTLRIDITPVNDPPIFNPPPTLYVKRGLPYTFNFAPYISDIDTPASILRLTANRPYLTTSGLNVTFNYPANHPDPWDYAILTVDDGALAASQSLTIGITDDTPPRLLSPLPDQSFYEDTSILDAFDLDNYFLDPDNDALYYTYGFVNVLVTIKENHSVDFRAKPQWSGAESGTFRAVDQTGAIAEDSILVTVLPVNNPPEIDTLPPFVVHFNQTYTFDLGSHIHDPDNDLDEISIWTNLPANATVTGTVLRMYFGWQWSAGPPPVIAPYTLPLTIFAEDPEGAQDYLVTTVTVGYDFPPELRLGVSIPDQIVNEDELAADRFNLDTYFWDPDSSTLFYSSGQVNIDVTIKGNHSVDFFPNLLDWHGAERVTFRAMDADGAYAEDTIKVTVRPVNDAPRIRGPVPEIVSRTTDFFFNLGPYIYDVENDTLTIRTDQAGVTTQGFIVIFNYAGDVREDVVNVTVSDYALDTYVQFRVRIVGPDLLMTLLPWILAFVGAAAILLVSRMLHTVVEHVFLIYGGGVPIVHLSRTLTADKDPDLVASMFTAIQSFMDESFHSIGVGELKGIELADHRVAVAKGHFVSLIILYRGARTSRIDKRANRVVEEIERTFHDILRDWNGDVARIDGVRQLLERFYGAKDTGQVVSGLHRVELDSRGGPANGK